MPHVHVHGYDNEVIFSPHDEESMNFKTITFTNYQTKLLFIIELELLPQLKLNFFALMLHTYTKKQVSQAKGNLIMLLTLARTYFKDRTIHKEIVYQQSQTNSVTFKTSLIILRNEFDQNLGNFLKSTQV